MNLIVTEVNLNPPYEHRRVFRVPIDVKGKLFDYRGRVSINSFFFGVKKRNYKKDKVLYHSVYEEEHKMMQEEHKMLRFGNHPINYIDVDSIWEFYKMIGYDYKKQEWLSMTKK